MEFHPIADIFPVLKGKKFDQLKNDIAVNGLHEAGWTHDGKLIDGRNRYRACKELDIPFPTQEWDKDGSLVNFVVSLNLHRRHLTSSQRAVVALEVLPALEEEAKERQGQRTDIKELIPESKTGQSRDKAAEMFQTNPRYITGAKKLKEEAPELLEQVKSGEKTIPEATKEFRHRTREKEPVLDIAPALKSPRLIVALAECMPQVDDESIDLIITSPPYNLGDESWPMGGSGRTPREAGIGYKDKRNESEYQDWQIKCLCEMYRTAKPGASLFYNHKIRNRKGTIIHPMDWLRNEGNPWIIRQEIVWDRGSTHNHATSLFWPEDERIYWMTKGKPELPNRPIGISTVWHFHGPVASTWQPAPFPPELPEHCIKAVGRDGIAVLDPFAGSCTTLKVALSYGYDAIGVDKSEDYLIRAQKENGWTKKNEV